MDNEGRVFTTYSCKGNDGKEHPVLASSGRHRQDPKPGTRVGVCYFTQQRQGEKKKSRYLILDCEGKKSLGAEEIKQVEKSTVWSI